MKRHSISTHSTCNRTGRHISNHRESIRTVFAAGLLTGCVLISCNRADIGEGTATLPTPLPELVALAQVDSTIAVDVRYATNRNFLGRVVRGYEGQDDILITPDAGLALLNVQKKLATEGLGLLVYDAYRPQIAVDHFVEWSLQPADTVTKAEYYPGLDKPSLFELGYIAKTSGHTRGNTVDLTLISLGSSVPLDMGSPFDFFGEISHHGHPSISPEQALNRLKLREAMESAGFSAYEKEWWHYRFTGSNE